MAQKKFPKKPLIRKLGTISCNNIVETTPIVFNDELYRFEVVRRKSFTSENKEIQIEIGPIEMG